MYSNKMAVAFMELRDTPNDVMNKIKQDFEEKGYTVDRYWYPDINNCNLKREINELKQFYNIIITVVGGDNYEYEPE